MPNLADLGTCPEGKCVCSQLTRVDAMGDLAVPAGTNLRAEFWEDKDDH